MVSVLSAKQPSWAVALAPKLIPWVLLCPASIFVVGVDVTVSDLLTPLLILAMATTSSLDFVTRRDMTRSAIVLWFALTTWGLALIFHAHLDGFASFLALAVFLKSFAIIAPVITLVRRFNLTKESVLLALSWSGFVVVLPIYAGLGSARARYFDEQLGTYFVSIDSSYIGLDLFASGQVNLFSYWLGVGACAGFIYWSNGEGSSAMRRATLGVSLAIALILVQTGSRTGLMLLAAFAILEIAVRRRSAVSTAGMLMTISIAVVLISWPTLFGFTDLISERVKNRLAFSEVGNIDRFSSGRAQFVNEMLLDIARSPIFGTGFSDFELFPRTQKLGSPHNQWIGAFHKMGILGGCVYMRAVFQLAFGARVHSRAPSVRNLIVACFVTALVLDSLTAPVTAIQIALLMGLNRAASEPPIHTEQPNSTGSTAVNPDAAIAPG